MVPVASPLMGKDFGAEESLPAEEGRVMLLVTMDVVKGDI